MSTHWAIADLCGPFVFACRPRAIPPQAINYRQSSRDAVVVDMEDGEAGAMRARKGHREQALTTLAGLIGAWLSCCWTRVSRLFFGYLDATVPARHS